MADLEIRPGILIPERELMMQTARASGPGGQNVNKVETKVEVRFYPDASSALSPEQKARLRSRLRNKLTVDGALIVTSDRTRHQHRNREDALEKLAEMIRGALARPRTRRPTKPTRGSVERRIKAKKSQSDKKKLRKNPIEH